MHINAKTEEKGKNEHEETTAKTEEKEEKTTPVKTSKSVKVSWSERLDQCKAFRKENGHCKIPTSYKKDKSLGNWVQETRRNFKLLKTGKVPRRHLSDEMIEELESIEFHWGFTPDPNSPESDASWEANFNKLQEYKETHGSFDMDNESPLGTWAKVQRKQKKCRDSKTKTFTNKKRVDMLSEIDFNWDGDRNI